MILGGGLIGSLSGVPAESVDVLGRQPEMRHHRDPDVGHPPRHLDGVRTALDLHRVGVGFL